MRSKIMVGRLAVLETLEQRRLLSVTMLQSGSALQITGNAAGDSVQILDQHAGLQVTTTVSVDRDKDGSFFSVGDKHRTFTGVTNFSVNLNGLGSALDIRLNDNYIGVNKSFVVRMANGDDHFNFTTAPGQGLRRSHVTLDVNTGSGDDQVSLSLQDIASSSSITGTINTNGGNDRVQVSGYTAIRDSNVAITTNLGSGNDSYQELIDLEGFRLYGTTSSWRTTVNGGIGRDTITQRSANGSRSAAFEGVFSNDFLGGLGNDTLEVAMEPVSLNGGTLHLNADGGDGNDNVSVAATAHPASTGGRIDILAAGGKGNDALALTLNADNTLNTYSHRGAVLDGGEGSDIGTLLGSGRMRMINL